MRQCERVGQRGASDLGGRHSTMPPPLLRRLLRHACSLCVVYLPALQEMDEMEERLRSKAAELEAARQEAESATERVGASEARERDLYEENKRLTAHISVSGARGWAGGQVVDGWGQHEAGSGRAGRPVTTPIVHWGVWQKQLGTTKAGQQATAVSLQPLLPGWSSPSSFEPPTASSTPACA